MRMFLAGFIGVLLVFFFVHLYAGLIRPAIGFALIIILCLVCIDVIKQKEQKKETEK